MRDPRQEMCSPVCRLLGDAALQAAKKDCLPQQAPPAFSVSSVFPLRPPPSLLSSSLDRRWAPSPSPEAQPGRGQRPPRDFQNPAPIPFYPAACGKPRLRACAEAQREGDRLRQHRHSEDWSEQRRVVNSTSSSLARWGGRVHAPLQFSERSGRRRVANSTSAQAGRRFGVRRSPFGRHRGPLLAS